MEKATETEVHYNELYEEFYSALELWWLKTKMVMISKEKKIMGKEKASSMTDDNEKWIRW
jgi:hypothetical protein